MPDTVDFSLEHLQSELARIDALIRREGIYAPYLQLATACENFDQGTIARLATIVIDPGHGGEDPGAIGRHGSREKDVTLTIARRLKALAMLRSAAAIISANRSLPEARLRSTRSLNLQT